ncbi:hypothetical protein Poly30_29790 [Planctomycetes bacterium Poly30]|uniref:Lipopolysaccharide-assembly n=1 Tax=Saltatorellus ferox TaxID=2528018 RepID=A0A518ETN4_9BACT|nr:hypothetical protein Poly30_29790 [Planctomycetes bacterium Poly30]
MSFSPSLLVSAALAGVLLAHGCATVSSSVMIPESIEAGLSKGGSVRIDAEGSSRQAFVGRRLVATDALESAVRESVLSAGLYDEVVHKGKADRVLSVTVDRLEEPEIGLDMTCEVALRWRLMSGDRASTYWEEVITTKETINTYQETDSSKRAMKAVEAALRSNLHRGIVRLSNAG